MVEVTFEVLISFTSLLATVIGLTMQYFGVIVGVKERLSKIEVKTDLFWGLVQQNLPNLLHADHTPRKDFLLGKMQEDKLTRDEMLELEKMLEEEMKHTAPDKILTYIFVIAALKRRLLD